MTTIYGPFFKKPARAEDVPKYVLDKCRSCRKLLHDRQHFYTGGYQDTFYCSDSKHSVYKFLQRLPSRLTHVPHVFKLFSGSSLSLS